MASSRETTSGGSTNAHVASSRDFVQSLERGLIVIEAFDRLHPRLNLLEATQRSGLSRSATRRLLQTLANLGYVSYDGHDYRLTARVLDLGYSHLSRLSLPEIARPHIEALSRQVHQTVSVAVLDGDEVLYVIRAHASRIMNVAIDVGSRLPAHLTALGRALLAWLSEDDLVRYLQTTRFDALTPFSVTDPDELREDLLQIRANGWSMVSQQLEEGLSAVGAPIRNRKGRVVAALNISVQANSISDDRLVGHFVPSLLETAARIGVDLHNNVAH